MPETKWNEWIPKIVSNPNWRQAWFLSGLISLIWVGIAYFVPDHYFKPVAVIVILFQNITLYIIRGGKYVLDRTLEIPDGPIVTPPTIPNGKLPAPPA